MKDALKQIGISNLIPVGSAVTKTVRSGSMLLDIILNYNKQMLGQSGHSVEHLTQQVSTLIAEKLGPEFMVQHQFLD